MNEYTIDDIYIGKEASYSVTITADMMDSFRRITADENPLHTNESFAKDVGYKDKVCYGLLTSSFFSTLAGVYLPGRYSLIRSIEIKYAKPVYVGDMLEISGVVTAVNKDYGFFDMKLAVHNEAGEKVIRGKMQVGFTNK